MKLLKLLISVCVIFAFTKVSSQSKTFGAGEELKYSLSYGIIKGGEGRLTVKDTVMKGQKLYHITATGYTTGVVDAVYKIRDVYESFINPETVYPVKSIRNIKEGKYRWYNEVLFKHGPDSTHVTSQRSGEKYVHADIYDIVSAFYIGRKKYFNDSMVVGQVIEIQTYFADEVFTLRIRYRGIEVIKTAFGKVECYKFSPVTEVGRAFKSEDDMHVWITRDKNRLPIRVKFNLIVGSFVCELETFKGLQNQFSSIRF